MAQKTMIQQELQFDTTTRDAAIDRVGASAPEDWMRRAVRAVEKVAAVNEEFTTDALWDLIEPPREPRAMGAVMVEAAKSKLCEATERTRKSKRKECHNRPLRIWRSLVFVGRNGAGRG